MTLFLKNRAIFEKNANKTIKNQQTCRGAALSVAGSNPITKGTVA
jgi:hypothetical protein